MAQRAGGTLGRRGRRSGRQLAEQIAADPNLRNEILTWNAKLYDKNSPSVKQRRARIREEFLDIMRALHNVPDDMADDDVHKRFFGPSEVVDNAVAYINAIARSHLHKGRIEEKMKASTLRQRVEALWWWAAWEAGIKAGEVWVSWSQHLYPAVHKAAVEFNLGAAKWEKEYFGIPELRLLFELTCTRTRYVEWYKQQYVAWVLSYMTGARPGTLGVSKGYTGEQALHWKDITFFRETDGKPGIFLQVKLRWLKGQRDPHHHKSAGFDGATFLIKSCREAENIFVDLTLLVLLLAMERNLFGGATMQELLNHSEAVLPQEAAVAKLPVFAALHGPNSPKMNYKNPMRAHHFNPPLQRSAYQAGLACRVTMYAFRREFITTAGRNLSVEEAKVLATHRCDELGSYGRYDYGTGDLDIAAVILAESSDVSDSARARNLNRRKVSSAAIHKQAVHPKEEQRAFVKMKMSENDLIIDFENALLSVLQILESKLNLPENTAPRSIQSTLKALKNIVDEIDTRGSSSAPAEWVIPDEMDTRDAEEWVKTAAKICEHGPKVSLKFLETFILQRKAARNHIMRSLQAIFDSNWRETQAHATTAEAAARLTESNMMPKILDVPASAGRVVSSARSMTIRQSQKIAKDLETSFADSVMPNFAIDESGADDLTAVDIPPWDGQTVDTSTDANYETSDEIDMSLIDPASVIRNISGPIEIIMPGEELEIEKAASMGTTAKAPEQTLAFYQNVRARLVTLWTECVEVPRGEHHCRACSANVDRAEGQGRHQPSAFKYIRHLDSDAHDPLNVAFDLWSNDRAKTHGNRFKCPLPGCESRAAFRGGFEFQAHCEQSHAAFMSRLGH